MSEHNHIDMEIIEDEEFSFDGFQVVRGEFFAHTYEPSLTFSDNKVYVNMACIRKLQDYSYIQILVNPEQKKVAVRPCREEERDSFRWCSATGKRLPKQITCRIFFAKVFALMEWDPNYRYKLLGKLIRTKRELLFVFDMTAPEVYKRTVSDEGKVKTAKTPNYLSDWQNQFGLPVAEHQGGLVISMFKNSAVFGLEKDPKEVPKIDAMSSIRTESEANDGDNAENGAGSRYTQLSLV